MWHWEAEVEAVKRGRPHVYADAIIQMLFGLKQVFRLPLRALQGFAAHMNKLAFADLSVPNYTTLCRRAWDLDVVLPVLCSGEPLHLVDGCTGLKVFGEGERKVCKHGYSKRRTRREVHLAMDANTGQFLRRADDAPGRWRWRGVARVARPVPGQYANRRRRRRWRV
ncbi:hypothetical protein L1274_003029 [Duganella sp. HSC-15S17]|uniref:Transposase DDE domain-containing protein n=1 Tax=Duganella violaceipulchra TaxID=2849652 RepID=A0ABT1GK21_9BURK|nr:hypothetical protein [Duganella violaceicalia]